jgi:cytochrome c peroxidase
MKIGLFMPVLLAAVLAAFIGDERKPLPTNEAELGEQLFFDPVLSRNRSVSCASCHIPAFAFADTLAFSVGWNGGRTERNTPGLVAALARDPLFWDGRSPDLEDQVLHPLTNPIEMGMTREETLRRLRKDRHYRKAFRQVYQQDPDITLMAKAIAAYERTLDWYDSPFDRYMFGDTSAMGADAVRGRTVFLEKGKCFECHFSPQFTIDDFRNVGLFNGRNLNDSGRMRITGKADDLGRFRVPGLRNVAVTAPYMHNGMFRTLEEVVDYYDNPSRFVPDAINRDTLLSGPLGLTDREKADLVAFLKALTASRYRL